MKRHTLYTLALLLAAAGSVLPLQAQRFETVYRRNAWNLGANRAGLRCDTLSLSIAEAWAAKQNGGMTDHSASDDSFSAGVVTESIRHFKKLSFAGSFSYDYFDGRNMSGSMFLHPGSYPFDIYEFTPGRKIRENYAFTGALSVDLFGQWRAGIGIDFAASNYAKRKDLRHKNTRLDFEVAPAVQWHSGDWTLGALYLFGKNSERIEAKEIGSTPLSYEAFFDKGLFYGIRDLWTSNSIHLTEAGITAFPVREIIHGASLQAQWRQLYADVTYRHSSGDTGEKGTTWHEFDGDGVEARIVWNAQNHFVRAHFAWNSTESAELVLTRETVGGVTNTVSWGSVPIYAGRELSTRLEWEWMRGGSDLRAGADYQLQRGQSSLLWPEVREKSLRRWRLWTEGLWAVGRVELAGAVAASWGSRSEQERMTADIKPSSDYPERLDLLAEWHDEYLTATRVECRLGVRVRIVKGFYADLAARYEHGFNLHYVPQPNRIEAILTLGYRW